MIKTFAHKGLETFFLWDSKRGIQPAHARRLAMILDQLEMHTMSTTSTTTELPPVQDRKRAPTHPGAIIKHECMEPLLLSVTALAKALGVSRKTVSKIVNERGAVTADMALRLSRAFKTTPQVWIDLQKDYELWHAATGSHGWKKVKTVELNRSA